MLPDPNHGMVKLSRYKQTQGLCLPAPQVNVELIRISPGGDVGRLPGQAFPARPALPPVLHSSARSKLPVGEESTTAVGWCTPWVQDTL